MMAERLKLINIRKRPRVCPVECPLHPENPRHNPTYAGGFVPPKVLRGSRLLVVGIAPGEEEELRGEPFVGPAGRYVERMLSWAGGSGSSPRYSKMNICNCRTTKPGRTKVINRTPPTAQEMRICMKAHLFPLLASREWELVLLLGGDAYKAVVPKNEEGGPMFGPFALAMGHRLPVVTLDQIKEGK